MRIFLNKNSWYRQTSSFVCVCELLCCEPSHIVWRERILFQQTTRKMHFIIYIKCGKDEEDHTPKLCKLNWYFQDLIYMYIRNISIQGAPIIILTVADFYQIEEHIRNVLLRVLSPTQCTRTYTIYTAGIYYLFVEYFIVKTNIYILYCVWLCKSTLIMASARVQFQCHRYL